MLRHKTAALTVALLALGAPARAEDDEVDASPRAAMRSFVDAARQGRWDDATHRLGTEGPGVTGPAFERLPQTARKLKAVLDSYLWLDLDALSDLPEGKTDDRLHPSFEEVGRVPSATGSGTEPVRLLRLASGRWVFSPATVARVPTWYDNLPDHWMREHLPDWLLRPGPRDVFWWQYLALTLLAVASFFLGRLLQFGLRRGLKRLARRTAVPFDDARLRQLRGPLTLFGTTVVAHVLLPLLLLTRPAEEFIGSVLSALRLLSLYWSLFNAVDLAAETARTSAFLQARPETKALLPLGTRTAKIALSIIAAIVVLQKLGYPAASLVAGLGIGGLAVALAAQKTVENLFGSVMLSIDQPFRPGDQVKVEDVVGIVESVGLRSTRIRTGERTVVTIPNGRLADMRIESFAPRDRLRLGLTLGLVHGTRSEQLRAVIAELQRLLEEHPRRHQEPPRVVFVALGPGSLDVEVSAWFATTDAAEFQGIKQEVLLRIMEVVERHGSSFAFPTRTLHLASVPDALTRPLPPPARPDE